MDGRQNAARRRGTSEINNMPRSPARAVIVHSAAHAAAVRTAAAQAKTHVLMISAPHLATAGGPLYTHALLGDADEFVIPVMDCGDDPGICWRALEVGAKCILFSGPDALLEKVRSAHSSVAVLTPNQIPSDTLDLEKTSRTGEVLVGHITECICVK